jgi:hypothetical protein
MIKKIIHDTGTTHALPAAGSRVAPRVKKERATRLCKDGF